MSKKYNVEVRETYLHIIEVEAKNQKEALEKAKHIYEYDDEYEFDATATSYEGAKFKIANRKV